VLIIAEMYFRKPEYAEAVALGIGYFWAIGLCTAGTLALVIAPNSSFDLAQVGSHSFK
jgi:NADH-quinone oxidoreductase subunit N